MFSSGDTIYIVPINSITRRFIMLSRVSAATHGIIPYHWPTVIDDGYEQDKLPHPTYQVSFSSFRGTNRR